MTRTIEYWDSDDEERLIHTDIDEAIESILDGTDKLPEKLEICGFARMELPGVEFLATDVLDRLLEGLDEDHGDPDGSYTSGTDKMKEAAVKFTATVLDEYVSWACEIVKRETVDVAAWVKENRPEWLEQEEIEKKQNDKLRKP